MVDVLVVNVILDMYELTTHRVVSNCDLGRIIKLDTVLELSEVTYTHGWMCMCVEFRDKILFRRGECKTREIPISGKMAKIVISITKL